VIQTLLTAREAAEMVQRQPTTIRIWAHRGYIEAAGRDPKTGAALYRRRDVWMTERAVRERDRAKTLRPCQPGGPIE